MEETSKHCVLGRHQTCSEERIEVLPTRSNAIVLYDTLPAYCIPKAIKMETGEVIDEKVYKNQLADILTEKMSHAMNGIIFCVCLTLAISVQPDCSEVMSKKNAKSFR